MCKGLQDFDSEGITTVRNITESVRAAPLLIPYGSKDGRDLP